MAKSKPIGVRFDLEKLELIQKEQNLSSPQAVLNFLMDAYNRNASNLAYKPINGTINTKITSVPQKELKNDKLKPPIGLTGIDLAIWKAENKNPR